MENNKFVMNIAWELNTEQRKVSVPEFIKLRKLIYKNVSLRRNIVTRLPPNLLKEAQQRGFNKLSVTDNVLPRKGTICCFVLITN